MGVAQTRRNSRGERSRAHILQVSEELFGELGFHGTSIRRVASETQMPTASLLHHFPTKQKLYAAVLRAIAADIDAVLDTSLNPEWGPTERLQGFIDGYLAWFDRKPGRGLLLLRELLDNRARLEGQPQLPLAGPFERMRDFVAKGVEQGDFQPIDPSMAVLQIIGAVSYFHAARPTIARIEKRSSAELRQSFQKELWVMAQRLLLR